MTLASAAILATVSSSIAYAPPAITNTGGANLPRLTDAAGGHTKARSDASAGGGSGQLWSGDTFFPPARWRWWTLIRAQPRVRGCSNGVDGCPGHRAPRAVAGAGKDDHAQVRALAAREVAVAWREIEVAEEGAELAKIARVEGLIRKREVADIERQQGELVKAFEDTMIEWHTIDLRILTAMAAEEGVRTTTGAFIRELDERAQELDSRAQELDRCDRVLRDAEAAAANSEVELQVREDALAERERALEVARQVVEDREAAVIMAEKDSAVRERNTAVRERAIAEREAAVEGCEAMADLERARRRIADLEYTLDLGTSIMAASVARLHEAAREVGVTAVVVS
uniref:Uncharacterized protein n=1 Tax=Leersia perrieri TaxID=77586 RepID=A0A0D9X6C4_9ORYZ